MKDMTLGNIAECCRGIYYGEEEKKTLEVTGDRKSTRLNSSHESDVD